MLKYSPMKKILILGLVLCLFVGIASAQQTPRDRFFRHRVEQSFRRGEISRFERRELYRDHFRLKMIRRRILRDGFATPYELRQMNRLRREQRYELYHYPHKKYRI
jgi:hypothetical protein